jgi:hypothetical protein
MFLHHNKLINLIPTSVATGVFAIFHRCRVSGITFIRYAQSRNIRKPTNLTLWEQVNNHTGALKRSGNGANAWTTLFFNPATTRRQRFLNPATTVENGEYTCCNN